MAIQWHIALHPRRQPCGCATWQQWDQRQQAWTLRIWHCTQHED